VSHQPNNPLGQATIYASLYAPELLFPIERKVSRDLLGLQNELPFAGYDVWTAYELSWLNEKGKPLVALAEFVFPCESPFIIESKSFKLYLNSFNQTKFISHAEVTERLENDLSRVAGEQVKVNLLEINDSALTKIQSLSGICLDELDVTVEHYHPAPDLLTADNSTLVSETVYSHLLKSNCPVTGQPDWASVVISYKGKKINHENLLSYIISFREHQDFHENCVERIFCDIQSRCRPEVLTVYARYTRRGGLDINPYRSTENNLPESMRLVRQ